MSGEAAWVVNKTGKRKERFICCKSNEKGKFLSQRLF